MNEFIKKLGNSPFIQASKSSSFPFRNSFLSKNGPKICSSNPFWVLSFSTKSMKSKPPFTSNKPKTFKTTNSPQISSTWNNTPKMHVVPSLCSTLSWMHLKTIHIWSKKTLIFTTFSNKTKAKPLRKLDNSSKKTKTSKKIIKNLSKKDKPKFNKKFKLTLSHLLKKMASCMKWMGPKNNQSTTDKQLKTAW